MSDPTLQLIKLYSVAHADTPPLAADAGYLFSESSDNESFGISTGAKLYADGRVSKLLCSGSGPYQPRPDVPEAFSGFNVLQRRLIGMGVPERAIEGLPMPERIWHTGVEAHEYVLH